MADSLCTMPGSLRLFHGSLKAVKVAAYGTAYHEQAIMLAQRGCGTALRWRLSFEESGFTIAAAVGHRQVTSLLVVGHAE